MSWLSGLLAMLAKAFFEAIGVRDLIFTEQTKIEQGKSDTVRMERTNVSTDRARIARLKSRYGGVVLLALLLIPACSSTEKERIEQRPVFVMEHAVINAAVVTDNREVEVLVLNDKGEPASAGALPAPVRIDGKVVVGPVRFQELLDNEKAYAVLLKALEGIQDATLRKSLIGY